jgi:hypothetical protein
MAWRNFSRFDAKLDQAGLIHRLRRVIAEI